MHESYDQGIVLFASSGAVAILTERNPRQVFDRVVTGPEQGQQDRGTIHYCALNCLLASGPGLHRQRMLPHNGRSSPSCCAIVHYA